MFFGGICVTIAPEELVSRYFVEGDSHTDLCLMRFPADWWSRLYEYVWAGQFASEEDICLDVACGVPHPFKFFLASKCKKVYACDNDAGIGAKDTILKGVRGYFSEQDTEIAAQYIDSIDFNLGDVMYLERDYEPEMFDKIYCISALEHMPAHVIDSAIEGFSNLLKEGGLVVLTIDIPTMPIQFILDTAFKHGLQLVGSLDLNKPEDAIYSPLLGGLNCFRILLTK